MTSPAASRSKTAMLPYRRQGDIDYARLDFNPDEPVCKPDAMEQHLPQDEIVGLLGARFTDFNRRPDVFLDRDSNICYDPSNLNVRVSPDVYLAFGVDARAIRPRKLYLPWEVGKPPDWALEVASESTAGVDIGRKPAIYARIGILEYWQFDPSGGRLYGRALYGGILVGGVYRPVGLTTEPDGILKGYSPVLRVYLCWDEGWPRLYDPATGRYDESWREVWSAREAERAARLAAETAHAVTEATLQVEQNARLAAETARQVEQRARLDAEMENRRLRELLRRLEPGSASQAES